jgi:hypothetical protein
MEDDAAILRLDLPRTHGRQADTGVHLSRGRSIKVSAPLAPLPLPFITPT